MLVETDVQDVLPDGTITRLTLNTEAMIVTISRNEPDQSFMIEKIKIVNHDGVENALDALSEYLHRYCIYSIDVECINGNKATLNI